MKYHISLTTGNLKQGKECMYYLLFCCEKIPCPSKLRNRVYSCLWLQREKNPLGQGGTGTSSRDGGGVRKLRGHI